MRQRLALLWLGYMHDPLPESSRFGADDAILPEVSKADLQHVLRRFRHREMVCIALRDISAPADIAETLRAMVHRLNLKQQPAFLEDNRFTAARNLVIRTWNHYLDR